MAFQDETSGDAGLADEVEKQNSPTVVNDRGRVLSLSFMYEYTTVKLLGSLTKSAERDWPDILNTHADEGWRLVAVDQNIAFFEREVDDD